MKPHLIPLLLLTSTAAGCAVRPEEIGRQPALSTIGGAPPAKIAALTATAAPKAQRARGDASAWSDTAADLFRDARAMRAGDVITVRISIKDRANLDNTSNRSRDSSMSLDGSTKFDLGIGGFSRSGEGSGQIGSSAKTESTGKGGVARSENIDLLVAAVVSEVLHNGNLVIQGTQEVRVNFKLRELTVAGIVRPRDISTDNSVSYERIAEARISYGGRGRIMEVQQPGWGQQIIDSIAPF